MVKLIRPALPQEHRLERLQLEFEETMRLKALREERELSRMERKLQNAAATYIQYVWRKRRYFADLRVKRDHAARCILAAVRLQAGRRRRLRCDAAIAIQERWRAHRRRELLKRCLHVVSRFIGSLVRARRAKRTESAVRIQRWLRRVLERRRREATAVLQRAWRAQLSKKKIARCSKAYRHLKELENLERNARVLQRALATRAAFCRLIRSKELARYPQVMAASLRNENLAESQFALQQSRRELSESVATGKRLANLETLLANDIEILRSRLRESKTKLVQEQDKLERFHALEAHRRSKDDAEIQQRLQELETHMRKDVRMEFEKELEAARRAQVREKRKQLQKPTDVTGAGSTFDDARYRMRKPSASSPASGFESRAVGPVEETEERQE